MEEKKETRFFMWQALKYPSVELCKLQKLANARKVQSTIIGSTGKLMFKVSYDFILNDRWETQKLNLHILTSENELSYALQKLQDGNWALNDKVLSAFQNATEIDISVSPFTNTLPINRLELTIGQSAEISVIYFNVLECSVTAVRQKYTRTSINQYLYQNIPNDFEAVMTVDGDGFVTEYPPLFTRGKIEQADS